MADPLVLSLPRCSDPSLVGGKASGLARLLAAGLAVPDGCCVTTRAYERSLATLGFDPRERWRRALELMGEDRRQELQGCRAAIGRSDLSGVLQGVWEELQRVAGARERRWALRSSASNEDSGHASAAGLYRTVLGVQWEELAGGIIEVWASLWEERVLVYMAKSGTGDMPPSMAVVIQPLLDPTIAGVAYSIDPVTGRDRYVTINAIRGLGQPLVDGTVTPDQYLVETIDGRPRRVIRRIPGQQHERMVVAAGGIAMEPIPSAEQDRTMLGDQQLFEIAALTKRIEQLFQRPVDVEWAIDHEGLWTLQARPVTAFQASSDPTNEESEWSRANFKETMPELPSPMGLSFLEHFMDAYILSHYRRLGCRIPSGLRSVRIHAGRPYLNVTLFHMLVGQLGGDPELNAEHMGGDPIQSAPPVQQLGWSALVRAGWLMWREMRRVLRESPVVFAEMKALAARYSRERVQPMSLTEVGAQLDELGRWLERREMTFAIAAGTGQCLQAFSRLLPGWLGPNWRRLLNESLQGQGTVISAQQILRIAELVELARKDVALSNALKRGWEPGRARQSFEGTYFLSAFDRYLEDYGHRAVGESDIMSPRLDDQPEALLEVIKTQLEGPSAMPEELIRRQRTVRDQALGAIRARCGWRFDRWLVFLWRYRRLCRFFSLREANRHHLMWYSLAARSLLLHLGELLIDRGVFTRKEDIFFLSLREREALEKVPTETWVALVQARRAEREYWKTLEVPDVICGWDDPQTGSHESLPEADGLLRGIPVSSGTVSGPVRFVRGMTDWSRVRRGDIIVAPVIDPGMAPLVGIAGGLIVELGGTLSHGAIIAREYGLPTVANVVQA
ncbi:MAG TPA: PEP/pyruvate-binding domain-containing protein, partial [Nitrospira sp.]|nr:PEP/pyruvate-binding domain-containing protein [Nitrospira sp.]